MANPTSVRLKDEQKEKLDAVVDTYEGVDLSQAQVIKIFIEQHTVDELLEVISDYFKGKPEALPA